MNILEKIKNISKARQLLELNKPIELMTNEEMGLEFGKRFEDIKKNNIIDDRSNQIIEMMLKKHSREKNKNSMIIFNFMSYVKSYDLRKDILKRYAKYIEEDMIDDFIRELKDMEHREISEDKIVKRQQRMNHVALNIRGTVEFIKRAVFKNRNKKQINYMRRIGSFRESRYNKLEEEAIGRFDEYEGIIYSENIDKIDLLEKIEQLPFPILESIYKNFDKNIQSEFLLQIMSRRGYLNFEDSEDEKKLIDELLKNVPEAQIKEEILKKGNFSFLKEKLGEKIKITAEDVKNFGRKYGTLNYCSTESLYDEEKSYTAIKIVEEIQALKDDSSRISFLFAYMYKMDKEEVDKLVFDASLDSDLKYAILQVAILKKTYSERIKIFDSLDDDMRERLVNSFTTENFERDKSDKDISAEEYINTILSKIDNNRLYDKYLISASHFEWIDLNKVFDVLKSASDKSLFDKVDNFLLLRFSDTQIKQIFDSAPDHIRERMLNLTRRKSNYTFR